MQNSCEDIYYRRLRDVKNNITRMRIAHANNESIINGPHVVIRWSCDMPPHVKMAVAMMAKLQPARTINDISWRRRK